MKETKKITKTQMIHTRINQNLFDSLKKKADRHDISLSQMIRIVLQKVADPNTKFNVGVSFES